MRAIHLLSTLALALMLMASNGIRPTNATEIADALFIEMRDEAGQVVTIADYDGAMRLVFFGFSACPDICPMTLAYIGTALNSLGPLGEQVVVLFVSVDPKRDTPEVLTEYTEAIHPAIIGLTGSYDRIQAVTAGFRTTFGHAMVVDGKSRPLTKQEYEELTPDAPYVPFHNSQIYLLGADGELRDVIGYGSDGGEIEAILRAHLDEA